ncbi:AAA family ATPase [Leptolyngbya sp. CCNP1308]|uniref:AAA family ATPase n=1 Tax=Leptolyngbya sp. CCNP1308 TaxID=3110255 RepID=UPI002B20A6E1|nr:AAA family ATPase [Leptolyngbya sp. CCNP1308]MEA5452124.1 AAA family ATPase [Leptolyngbya sp. CCNP1308]
MTQDAIPVPLLMLVGIPGSGKSTWARDFVLANSRYRIVSTDDLRAQLYGDAAIQGDWLRIWQQVVIRWRQAIAAIHQGELEGVIYDATNARRRHRREAIAAARQSGFAPITLVWFDLPLSLALERNRGRSQPVPDDIIAAMHRQLQGAPPSMQEGVDRVLVLRTDLYPGLPSQSADPLR